MRAVALWAALVLVTGCGDSGCSGMEPIPGGFPLDRRVENAVQVRMTPSGVDFLEANLAEILGAVTGGALLFPIPPSTQDVGLGVTAEVCPSGGCFINIEIRTVNLVPTPPNQIRIHMNVRAWAADSTGEPRPLPIEIHALWTTRCDATIDTRRSGSPELPVTGTVVFVLDTTTRYTRVEFIEMDATSGFEDDDIDISGGAVCWIVDLLKGLFIGELTGALDEQLTGAIEQFSCLACEGPADCPADATCTEGVCRRGEECVGTLLGIEGRTDLGAAMASVSPGLSAPLDLLVAAGGHADAVAAGISLGFFGGAEPVTPSACVPRVTPPPLGPVPVSPTIHGATSCPHCTPTEAHLAVGVSETFLDRFGWGLHQSGALCLGVGGSTLPISSGMLALLMPSLRTVTWGVAAPLAIELRPNEAPTFELGDPAGGEPLLAVTMNDLSLDFYVWAWDRYARLMQANLDLTVDLAIDAVAGQLEVSATGLNAENLTIREADLLDENLDTLAEAFASLVTDMVAPMLGDLGAFPLPDFMGFSLRISDGGLGYLQDGGEEFLAIYASLALAPPVSARPDGARPVGLSARIQDLDLPTTEVFAGLEGPRRVPRVTLGLEPEAAGDGEVELRTRIGSGFWSPWSRRTEVVLEDPIFLFQGRHRVAAQARLVGRPETASETVTVAVIIDTVPPELEVRAEPDGSLSIRASDMVTPEEALRVEYRSESDAAWQPVEGGVVAADRAGGAVEIRATDEAGNVGVARHGLRGRLPSEPSSDCGGCATTGGAGRGAGLLLLVALAALLLLRRPEAALPVLLAAVVSSASPACSGPAFQCADGIENCCESDADCPGGRCCEATHQCVVYTRDDDTCPAGQVCAEPPPLDESCEFTACPNCIDGPGLPVGLVGLHSSVAVTPSGDLWVAGYAAGTSHTRTYGDLAVALVQGRPARIPEEAWVVIDGVPPGVEPEDNPNGFRGGVVEPGDDVGHYASVALDSAGNPSVAYYDRTHGALMFSSGSTELWTTPVLVDGGDGSDAGRFADLLVLPSGLPAIAYMSIERRGDGSIVTRARYVQALTAAGTSWSQPVDLDVLDPTPCSMALCSAPDGEVCDLTTGRCVVPGEGCGEGCDSGEACVGGECREVLEGAADLVEGTGVWPELAQGPGDTMGVVFYDRTNGNLMGVAFDGAAWGDAQILAGHGGDMGWAPSLFIDDRGTWHMSFVDGLAEDLRYLSSDGANEVVDGRSLGAHWSIRGDDSSIFVGPDGTVRVAYQDATELRLMLAERDASGVWATRELAGSGLAASAAQGFFVNQARAGGSSVVSAWFFDASSMGNGVLLFWL